MLVFRPRVDGHYRLTEMMMTLLFVISLFLSCRVRSSVVTVCVVCFVL